MTDQAFIVFPSYAVFLWATRTSRASTRRVGQDPGQVLLLDRNDRPSQICNDYIDLELDELTRDLSEALGATLRPSILDRDSTALDSAPSE
jgi:hypothetical protein